MEANRQLADRGGRCLGAFTDLSPSFVLVEADLGAQLDHSCEHTGSAEAVTKCRSLCSSKQVAQGQSQAASEIGLYESLSRDPRTHTPSGHFQTISEQDPISFRSGTSTRRSQQTSDPAEAKCTLCGQHQHSSSYNEVWVG